MKARNLSTCTGSYHIPHMRLLLLVVVFVGCCLLFLGVWALRLRVGGGMVYQGFKTRAHVALNISEHWPAVPQEIM